MMNRLNINHVFAAEYPDGFHEMNSGELIQIIGTDADVCGVYDEERHIVFTVGWFKPKFFGLFTDERSLINGTKAWNKRNLRNYRHVDTLTREIAGCKAIGERCEYTVKGSDIVLCGDIYALRYGKMYYGVRCLARKEGFEESQRETESFLQSMTILR